MKKNILNLGKSISKSAQKNIKGGMLSQINCSDIFDECNACHPNNESHFNACMQTFGCATGPVVIQKK